MPSVRLRFATTQDAAEIARIYAYYVDNTVITFETEAPGPDEMARRIETVLGTYPYLVAETGDGRFTGYAYAVQHMARAAYRWNALLSIFLDYELTGSGLGRPLYRALLDILKLQGYRNAYAIITAVNEPSVRFHERFGFTHAGTLGRSGYKLGEWRDIHWYEKRLIADRDGDVPEPPLAIDEVDTGELEKILG